MKLKSMTSYVDSVLDEVQKGASDSRGIYLISGYSKFLKEKFTKGMFVPCDEEGKVLEEPHNIGLIGSPSVKNSVLDKSLEDALKYQAAKERVLFKGFEVDYIGVSFDVVGNGDIDLQFHKDGGTRYDVFNKIEQLVEFNLELTQTAINQICN